MKPVILSAIAALLLAAPVIGADKPPKAIAAALADRARPADQKAPAMRRASRATRWLISS